METAREKVVDLCKRLGIPLNETYAKTFKYKTIKLWKYKEDSKARQRRKIMISLKVRLGRLIRICQRAIEKSKLELSEEDCTILCRAKNIHAQSILKKKDKDIYKKENKIIYSFHAPEVECIGKGKLNKPYEFGNKVGIAVSGRGNFVLGVKSFHGNPYDGHTLDQTVVELRKLSPETSKIFVDLGYTGHNFKEKGKVFTAKTKKTLSNDDKKMQKRRSAIEPIIGHLKNFGRMGRNYLKGVVGDIVNPLISAVGLNLRRIANILKESTA
jgi:IS5 family transposase